MPGGGRLGRAALWAALTLGATAVAGADLGTLRERGVLRVLMVVSSDPPATSGTGASAPSGFDPQGRFDRELLEGFAQRQDLRVEIVAIKSYDRLIPALLEDRGDVIAGAFTQTEARQKLIDFTVEVFPNRDVILSRRPQPAVHSLAELRSLSKVGAPRGSSEWRALLDAGVAAAVIGPTEDLSEDLRSGRYQAVAAPVEQAMDAVRADAEFEIGMFVGPAGSYAYGVRKQDASLKAALSEHIANFRRGAGWSRLVVKYYGPQAAEILKKIRE